MHFALKCVLANVASMTGVEFPYIPYYNTYIIIIIINPSYISIKLLFKNYVKIYDNGTKGT